MKLPLYLLALSLTAWAAESPQPDDQAAAAPAQTAPADAAKPADATPPAPPPKYDGFVFSAMADAYFTANFNHPISNANQLQNFDINNNQGEFSLGKVTVDKSDKMIGFHVDAGFGETMRLIHAGDVAAIDHQALRYFEQMYAIIKPNNTHGLEIDYGQFVTSAGAEVIESSSNWNYTRSLLFAWAIPYYHFGIRTTMPVTKTLTVGVQVVNGWNTVWGNHNMQNLGLTAALTRTKFAWTTNYYVGNTHAVGLPGVRNLFDTTLLLTPSGKVNFYINYDYGRDNHPGGYDSWYGIAGAGRVQITKAFAFAGRGEWFDDATGFATGTKQNLKEVTTTLEYKYGDHFVGRAEYRHDFSDVLFFDRGAQTARAKGEGTFTLGLVALLGPLK